MNEADTEPGTEITKGHPLFAILTGVEKSKMYEMGYANAHTDRADLFGEIVGLGFAGVGLLTAETGEDTLRSLYFGGLRLINLADKANDYEATNNAVRLHAYLLDRLDELGLMCSGFYSVPGWRANVEWKAYASTKQNQLFGERYWSEAHACDYRLRTATTIWAYGSITGRADEQTECDDHHHYSCWFCSYDN